MTPQILLIDDDNRLAEMLQSYLIKHGMSVEHRGDAESGIAAVDRSAFDAVVLDVMLPGMDGFEACTQLRRKHDIPILMLTARGDETDRIVGLELGADDYLPKPFNPRELLARLRAILRRRAPLAGPDQEVLSFGRLEIDLARREVRLDGKVRSLTSHQFALLRVLAERPGRVQSREQLMEAVRGEPLDSYDRSIDVHVSRIRAAIEDDPRSPKRIRTIRAAGYVFIARDD